ncbi:hypothetical protein CQW31_30160 [Pseudomonas sp. 382]|nr:hypothetical protein CQW31_30160 [Pseudomonas sp. 382]
MLKTIESPTSVSGQSLLCRQQGPPCWHGDASRWKLTESGDPSRWKLTESGDPSRWKLTESGDPSRRKLTGSGDPSRWKLTESGDPSRWKLTGYGDASRWALMRHNLSPVMHQGGPCWLHRSDWPETDVGDSMVFSKPVSRLW